MSLKTIAFTFFGSLSLLPAASVEARLHRLEGQVSELQALLQQFNHQESNSAPHQVSRAQETHVIRSGDSYWSIARRYGTNVEALKQANPRVNPRALQIGHRIVIPRSGSPLTAMRPASSAQTITGTYRVKKGDILGRISEAHGIRLHQLMAANPGLNPRRLQIGTVLHIPGQSNFAPTEVIPVTPPPIHPDPIPFQDEEQSDEFEQERGNPFLSENDTDLPEVRRLEDPTPLPSPDEPRLINVEYDARFVDIATTHNTTVSQLNELNNRQLNPLQMIKAGSQLFVPAD